MAHQTVSADRNSPFNGYAILAAMFQHTKIVLQLPLVTVMNTVL